MFPKIRPTQTNSIKIVPIMDYILRFDGCSKGNPGLAGCGAVIYYNDNEIWAGQYYVGEKETNNYAEYAGLILGLQEAIELNIDKLDVQGDSMLVIEQMNKKYNCKSKNLIKLYEKANELSRQFKQITFNHIYRQSNKRADELSNIAVDLMINDKMK
jgi:ribonuclease HI